MKSRTIEIIDNHIKALEEELEWYQEKNREWQEKCEKSDEEFHRCHKAYMIDTEYLTNKLAKCRDENARLREQLRWHSVSELPPRLKALTNLSVNVVLRRPMFAELMAYYSYVRKEWISLYTHNPIKTTSIDKWCYIPEDGDA